MTLEDLGLDSVLVGQFFAAGWACVMIHFLLGWSWSIIKKALTSL